MAYTDWRITGPELSTCNCNWGCPCQFNAGPSHGHCRAGVAVRIDQGHFGEVRLDDLHFVGMFAWPGAIHEGNGEAFVVLDERADARQQEALLTILSGKETEPGATIFNVFAATFARMHPPVRRPIEFEIDIARRRGRFRVPGLIEGEGEPIRNPVTGEEHRARVALPTGFEYREAEFGSSRTRADGAIPLDWANGHSHFCMLDLGPRGPMS